MAEKKAEEKIVLERKYTIPLRKEWLKSPIYRRAKKSITAIREFLVRHMKAEDIKIGKYLNEKIHERGRKNPPHKIEVEAKKIEKEGKVFVFAEMVGAPKEEERKEKEKKEKKEEEKKEEKKEGKEKLEEEKKKVLEKGYEKKEKIPEKTKFQSHQYEEKVRKSTIVTRTYKK